MQRYDYYQNQVCMNMDNGCEYLKHYFIEWNTDSPIIYKIIKIPL